MEIRNLKKPVFLVFAFLIIIFILFRLISTPDRILSWDVFGYYLYLPAKFIYHDIALQNFEWLNELLNKYEPTATLYQAIKIDNGNWVMKYSMGMAIVYFPFFMIAQLLALIFSYPADGLSPVYQYTMAIGGLLISFVGLIYLFKILSQFFRRNTCFIVLLLTVFGTNYFQLAVFDGTLLSHNFLFTLYAVIVYYTIRWHQSQKNKYAFIIGICCGLSTIIRPSEFVCVLIPLLWNIKDLNSLKEKFQLIKKYFTHIFILILSFLLMLLPQLLYWKSITGNYIFYSYTNPGEGFDLIYPHTLDFLFSFRKGWFIYTPIVLLSFIGMYLIRRSPYFLAILIFIITDIYIISSWSCWWYAGGSFSSRSIVPAYVILAIPMGYFIENISSFKLYSRYSVIAVISFLVLLNLFQTWQFEHGIITRETMTREYYFRIFGKTSVSPEVKKLLLVNRFTDANEIFENQNDYKQKVLYQNNFDNITDTSLLFQHCFRMNNNVPYSPGADMKYKELTSCDHAWIKISADVFVPSGFHEEVPLLVIHFQHDNKAYKYQAKETDTSSIKYNNWNHIELFYLTPEVRTKEDNFKAYLWFRGNKDMYIDNILIEAFEPVSQLSEGPN